MKRALIISFYWPPSGKASMHMPYRLAEYLPDYGIETDILTVKKDTVTTEDNSFSEIPNSNCTVYRSDFLDPFQIYKKIIGKSGDEKIAPSESISKENTNLAHRFSIWIRMNLFIPDARVGWYFPGIKLGRQILREKKYDYIISNGPPHSAHLIGKKLGKEFNIPFIPIFIDPWVDISSYKDQKRSNLTQKIDNRLEKSVIESAAKNIFVTDGLKKYFNDKYPVSLTNSHVLYWGYDESKFSEFKKSRENGDEKIILHAGNIFDHQNPINFWKQLKSEIEAGKNFRLKFVGTVAPKVMKSISEIGLDTNTDYLGFLPYNEMIDQLASADYLLVCVSETRHIPGKLFEYMRTGISIIAFADNNSEVAEILKQTNCGKLLSYSDDLNDLFKTLSETSTNLDEVMKFDRRNIAKEFSKILNTIKA